MNSNSPAKRGKRSSLFWRLWFRSLVVRRPQAAVALVSLLAGAAVASMLLNLYGDVKRKMTQEFRAYGANAVLGPTETSAGRRQVSSSLMDESALDRLGDQEREIKGLTAVPVLYAVARVGRVSADPRANEAANVIVTGADFSALRSVVGGWRAESAGREETLGEGTCAIGARVAERLKLGSGDTIALSVAPQNLSSPPAQAKARVTSIVSTGSAEDDQVFLSLEALQQLTGLEGKISLVQMIVPGDAAEVERNIQELRTAFPGLEVRPIRQIVYSQAKVLETIRSLLVSLTALIILIIALCVTATMTAIVIERRKDIAVMKALGAANEEVGRLFLAEGATLGLVAGLAGFPLGILLASELARRLFGVTLNVVWWTLPVICVSTAVLAVLGTSFPVGIVRRIQPATVLKGE